MVEKAGAVRASLPPQLRVLLHHWQTVAAQAPGGVPRSDVVLPHIRDVWLNHLALIEPGGRAGYLVTQCGFALIRRFGRFAAGHRVSTLASGIRQELSARLVRARHTRRVVAGSAAIPYGRGLLSFAEIVLPLSDDGESITNLALIAVELSWIWPRESDPPSPAATPCVDEAAAWD